eukprot:SAG31_NODE_1610_length_7751_cov_2.938447_7_plen_91_part_00
MADAELVHLRHENADLRARLAPGGQLAQQLQAVRCPGLESATPASLSLSTLRGVPLAFNTSRCPSRFEFGTPASLSFSILLPGVPLVLGS